VEYYLSVLDTDLNMTSAAHSSPKDLFLSFAFIPFLYYLLYPTYY
jgi:hypothetical protein